MEQLQEQVQQILAELQANRAQPIVQHEDIVTEITSGDQIQLEAYKSIPEFSGNKGQYRSWRNQVVRQMEVIENFKRHPKYGSALAIVRTKITGPASNVLTNNKTAYNIDAIIERLDTSYTDQRPLYIVEAEMTSIKQLNRTLQEFYDMINQALNLVISKIVMTYDTLHEQEALVKEMQKKAVRIFILGLRSSVTRNILYSHDPKGLEEAFTKAQTVYYDNQFSQFDRNQNSQKNEQTRGLPRTQQQSQSFPKFNVNMNCNPQQQPIRGEKQDQTEVNPKKHFKQTNWRQTYEPQKRERNSFTQNMQQPTNNQRINQLQSEESNPNEGYEGDICGEIPDELISNSSHETNETTESSAFLDE